MIRRVQKGFSEWIPILAAVVAILAFSSAVVADDTIGDGDGTTPIVQSTLDFGDVCRGATYNDTVLVGMQRVSAFPDPLRIFGNGEPVTVSLSATHAYLNGSTMNDGSIVLPGDWTSQAVGYIYEGDTAEVAVVLAVDVAAPFGASGTQTLNLTSTGDNYEGNPITRTVQDPKVIWNVVDCPTVTTEVHDSTHTDVTNTQIPLGSVVHDSATAQTEANNIPSGSTFDFYLYTGDDCNAGDDDTLVDSWVGVAVGDDTSTSETEESGDSDPLHAGDYSFKVFFNSGDTVGSDAVGDGEADCEPFEVLKGDTITTTDIGPWEFTDPVVDEATVDVDTGVYDGFILGDTTVEVTFTLYATNANDGTDCTGTELDDQDADFSGAGTPPDSVDSPNFGPLDPGYYCFQAEYSGNDDYNGSTSGPEPFSVVPPVEVLRGTCTFDLNPDETDWTGDQFKLIYTPWGIYSKLNASNPGQMFVDIFFINPASDPVEFPGDWEAYLMMPFPFVTQGAMAVHYYDGVTITEPEPGKLCYEPGPGLGPDDEMVTLQDYIDEDEDGSPEFGDTVNMDFDPVPAATSGLTLIRVHVDYGLKWNALNCYKDTEVPGDPYVTARACDVPWSTDFVIPDNQPYEFAVTIAASDTIYSQNIFKKDPGIGGLVIDANGDPVAGTTVEIWQGSTLWYTLSTDEDGWYMATFKYTGKATTFTVKLTDLGLQQSVTLKSNGYAIVNFIGDWTEFAWFENTSTSTSTSTDSGGGSKGGGPKKR